MGNFIYQQRIEELDKMVEYYQEYSYNTFKVVEDIVNREAELSKEEIVKRLKLIAMTVPK